MVRLEVCVDSLHGAIAATRGGADRLELCGNLGLGGGTTPSMGLFNAVHKALPAIPIMVMIRPRTGDFCYSSEEFGVMLDDIKLFQKAGAAGMVFGVLTPEGMIDIWRLQILLTQAGSMQVCIHRAFDMTCMPPVQALEAIYCVPGVTRILTSGQGPKAPDNLDTLASLLSNNASMAEAHGRSPITILPGSGINLSTLSAVLDALLPLGLEEIHMSAGRWVDNGETFRREGMGMGVGGEGEWGVWRTDESVVREAKRILVERTGGS